ncbi:MAG: hypothetical protein AAF512_17675 [Pseudomonadota bacterium]
MGKQEEMFPTKPQINNIGVVEAKLSDGELQSKLTAGCNVNDLSELTNETWAPAVAEWLLDLAGDIEIAQVYLREAEAKQLTREYAEGASATH